ncbi:MAG: hypothetical protein AAF515_09905 [Pseudomonadota bacterium]
MSLFEYLAIAFSIIISMSVIRVISGLPHVLHRGRRYWVHAAFVGIQLMMTIVVFWNYWNFATYTDWTLPKFILILASPALIYLNACTLVPERAENIESWRDYYFSVHRRYFLGLAAWLFAVAANTVVFLDMPIAAPGRIAQLMALLGCLAGAYYSSSKLHATLAAFMTGLMLFWIFFVSLTPGGMRSV